MPTRPFLCFVCRASAPEHLCSPVATSTLSLSREGGVFASADKCAPPEATDGPDDTPRAILPRYPVPCDLIFYEWLRRQVTPMEQLFNERSRDGVFANALRLHQSDHRPLAELRAAVRTTVQQGKEFTIDVEHANLTSGDFDDLVRARRDLRGSPHHMTVHGRP